MHPVLQTTRRVVDRAIDGAGEAALASARDGKWSAAAVIEHLALSYSGTAYAMSRALDKDTPIGTPPGPTQRIAQLLVVAIGYFPRVEAPAATRPQGLAPAEAHRAFAENLLRMDDALTACEERFGSRALVANHPILGGLTVNGWRRFHLQHARHHARQIRARLR